MTHQVICERCGKRTAKLLLGKGIVICNICHESPEDIIRDLTPHDRIVFLEKQDKQKPG